MAELDKISQSIKQKKLVNILFVVLMSIVELIILGAIVYIIVQFFKGPSAEIYKLVAMGILLIWFGIMVAYYAWAIYFYNINLGLTNESWAEKREEKKYSPEGAGEVPVENPNINQTLGLPLGTIRGTLALTLMMGALAMAIAALGKDDFIEENKFLVDNFDFFKTAFLMMIAFYFGNKSLEMISDKYKRIYNPKATKTTKGQQQPAPPAQSADASTAKKLLKQDSENTAANSTKEQSDTKDFDNPDAVQ
ncbi:MAG: hypothetical protein U9R19_01330 [Bacteroidota bacterium]|nr:hypothetical protein [Bacteroidota bacterium]